MFVHARAIKETGYLAFLFLEDWYSHDKIRSAGCSYSVAVTKQSGGYGFVPQGYTNDIAMLYQMYQTVQNTGLS